MRLTTLVSALALGFGLSSAAMSQEAATLLADSVRVTGTGTLIASGHVEVFYDGTRLAATEIRYDQASDTLSLVGPIMITSPDGTILTADSGDMDPKLRNGLLIGARLVLEQELQLAASEIARVDGRLTRLSEVAATSCSVCDNRPPLWEVRARTVTHDQDQKTILFEDAVIQVRGQPIFWLPRMRIPDPSQTRISGFLVPSYRSNDLLGLGFRFPYFMTLGDSRDLTVTPYISARSTSAEFRYRQAFANGELTVQGAVSNDSILSDQNRGYLAVKGAFDLENDYRLTLDGIMASDDAYLATYGYSDATQLESSVKLEQINSRSLRWAEIAAYQTLLDGQANASLPPLVAEAGLENRYDLAGGTLVATADADLHLRHSATLGSAGRDVARIGAGLSYGRDWITDSGLVLAWDSSADLNYYKIYDDTAYDEALRLTPGTALTLRYPLMRADRLGRADVIEPVAMIGWSETYGDDIPNEDSTRVEFDEGNLLSLSKFAGDDASETGLRAAVGLGWHHISPIGWTTHVVAGRVASIDPVEASTSSGLTGTASDLLLAGKLSLPDGPVITGRTLLNEAYGASKSELAIGWGNDRIDLASTYVWLPADADEDRTSDVSEWTLAADVQVTDVWSIGATGRYDIANSRPARSGLQIGWQNECVTVELSASRRYASSSTVEPTTDYGLTVGLAGFGTSSRSVASRRSCTN